METRDLYHLFIYLGFYVAFNTVQVISRWVVGRAEETSTYGSVLLTADQQQATISFPTWLGLGTEPQPQRWEVESVTTQPLWPPDLYHVQYSICA